MRLAVVTSHPIQYQAPLFRALAEVVDLEVFFCHRSTPADQASAGFDVEFEWDVDLTVGYPSQFVRNVARRPGTGNFTGCDTPSIGDHLRRGRFDALLVMGWHLKCYWQAIASAKGAGIPVLVRGDSHLDTPRSTLKRLLKESVYPRALRVFDAALYVGQRSRKYWQHYHYPDAQMFFSPHCVDTRWFAARATSDAGANLRAAMGIGAGERLVLFAGKLINVKKPFDLVRATALVAHDLRNVGLLIAGSGPLNAEVAAMSKAAGVKLHSLGFCNQTEMPGVYAAADVLVLPSAHETWGLVASEALACGLPVIVSDACGCVPDLAGDGKAGSVFPVGDVQALSDALRRTLSAPPPREQILGLAEEYSVAAAVRGVDEALMATVRRRG